jgi:hypothetical protein
MEEGKIATAGAHFALKESIHVYNACATLGNTFVSVGRLGSISAPLVNQPVVY